MSFFEFPHARTYDTDLGWLIKDYKHITALIQSLNEWKIEHEAEYEVLKAFFDGLMSGNYPEEFEKNLVEWIDKNALDIIGQLVKMVFFGITDDGYFVAYIPSSWNDITFGTSGLDDFPPGVDFGHLTLNY